MFSEHKLKKIQVVFENLAILEERRERKNIESLSHLRIVTKTFLGSRTILQTQTSILQDPGPVIQMATQKLVFPGTCIAFCICCLLGTKPERYCLETHQQGSTFSTNLQSPYIQIVIPWLKAGVNSTVLSYYATLLSHDCC